MTAQGEVPQNHNKQYFTIMFTSFYEHLEWGDFIYKPV
jgi:hypothetical protein